jgi:aspartate-semialdehyde dehydrogenase
VCASERSWGKKLRVNGQELTVEEATPELLGEVDLVFIAAGSDTSRELAPIAAERGAMVIDKSSAFRMDPAVPLVVPEVNAGDLDGHRGIVSTPNCSTTPLVMALKPLDEVNRVTRVTVATYQAVSGTGAAAQEELRVQSGQVLGGDSVQPDVYPHQIAFNVLPHVEDFLDSGYTTEEMKMVFETRKIMHRPDLPVSATCVRVPVMVSHSEAVHLELEHPMSAEEVSEVLGKAPGVKLLDAPSSKAYPMPIDVAGQDPVYIGRVRRDQSHPKGIVMWLVLDNLRKGAALNAVQIAEEMLSRELLPREGSA